MNTTKQEAYDRLLQFRTGIIGGTPTEEYLITLLAEMYKIIEILEETLEIIRANQAREEE